MNAHQFSRHRARIDDELRSQEWKRQAFRHLLNQARVIIILAEWKVRGWRLPTGEIVCIKRRYQDEASAGQVLGNIHLTSGTHKKPVRVYPCPYCSGWHLTSREK
jgi:hypothetical protein